MSEVVKKQNECLNFLKGIACFFVVFMHAEFPETFGTFVQCISRFSVPLFFMISGYFCRLKSKDFNSAKNYILKKAGHIFKIIIYACLVYFIFSFLKAAVSGGFKGLIEAVNLKNILVLLIFNQPFIINGSLWFLFALLYCYIFYLFIYKIDNIYFKLLPVFFILLAVLSQGLYLFDVSVENYIYRNFFFEGMPFFMLGNYLYVKKDFFLLKISNVNLLILLSIFTASCIVERLLLNRDFGVCLGTYFQVLIMFCLAINNPASKVSSVICNIGKKYSLFIYIMHRMVMETLNLFAGKISIANNSVYLWSYPVAVLIITLILAVVFYKLIDYYKIKMKGC